MSFNWDNELWQSADGFWNRGYYERMTPPLSLQDEDYDPEWDDEFNYGSFEDVTTGFRTETEADNWEPHGNPGGSTRTTVEDNPSRVLELDTLAAKCTHRRASTPVNTFWI